MQQVLYACPKITGWTTGKCMRKKIKQQTKKIDSLRIPITTLYKGGHAQAHHNLRKQVKKAQK
jgi:hypothetical protein